MSAYENLTEKRKSQRRKAGRTWAAAHKGIARDAYIKVVRVKKEWFETVKATHCCVECGESDPRCIDFHHRDPKQKLYTISYMANRGFSDKKILAELAKCVALCANCHRKHHHNYDRVASQLDNLTIAQLGLVEAYIDTGMAKKAKAA